MQTQEFEDGMASNNNNKLSTSCRKRPGDDSNNETTAAVGETKNGKRSKLLSDTSKLIGTGEEWLVRCRPTRPNTDDKNADLDISSIPLHFSLPTTLSLFNQLQQQLEEEGPISLVARVFDVLASTTTSDCDAPLRLCCSHLLRSTLCTATPNNYPSDAIATVLSAMERHFWSVPVQLEAGQLLQRLLVDQAEKRQNQDNEDPHNHAAATATCLQQQQGLGILFRSMQWHIDNPKIQYQCLDLIRRLQIACATLVIKPSDSGWLDGTMSILQALQRHPEILYLQQLGFSLLAWLAEHATCREVMIQAGALHWFVPDVMQRHRSDALIQCNASAVVCWLVHAGGLTPPQEEQERRLVQYQLDRRYIPAVLDIMQLHQDSASIFGNCVCLLCGWSDGGVALSSSSLVEQNGSHNANQQQHAAELLCLIQRGMEQHLNSTKVQEACLRWLRCGDANHIAALSEQLLLSIPTILKGMRLHMQASQTRFSINSTTEDDTPSSANSSLISGAHLQAQATAVMAVFAGHACLRQALLEHGAVDGVLEALHVHRNDQRVQHASIWFFTVVLLTTASEPTSMAFGGGPAVLETMLRSMGIALPLVGGDDDDDQ